MTKFVLDASALLALLNAENGSAAVQDHLSEAVISTVNLAEVVTRLRAAGIPEQEVTDILSLLGLETIPFDVSQAYQAGFFYPETQSAGLSLGDRACLALAKSLDATALTADQTWMHLPRDLKIQNIRQ